MQRLRHRKGKRLNDEDMGIRGKSKSDPRGLTTSTSPFFLLTEVSSSVNDNAFHTLGCILPRAFPCWLCLLHIPTDVSEAPGSQPLCRAPLTPSILRLDSSPPVLLCYSARSSLQTS